MSQLNMTLSGRYAGLCILLVCVVHVTSYLIDSNHGTYQSINLKAEREKRNGVPASTKAIRQLLNGLTKSKKSTDGLRRYFKSGDYKTALTDFNKLLPKNVRQPTGEHYAIHGKVFFGNVGYRRVKLLEKGTYIADNPVLEIRHSRGNEGPSIDRIIYKRKRNNTFRFYLIISI